MSKIIVTGHKNPDTDSVISALMLSRLLKKEGKEAIAVTPGEINKETEFVFNALKEVVPEKKESVTKEESVFLVDHNELTQSIAEKENIYGVLDHHALAGLKTEKAVYFRVEPLGSTCTLICKIMKERGIELSTEEADILLAGIISDTLNLTSSTTTSEDIDIYYELAEISKIDVESFSKEMFEAKSDFSGKSVKEIIGGDAKEYEVKEGKSGIGVCETTSLKYFEENNKEVVEAIRKYKEENSYDTFFFGIIDILEGNTYLYPAGEKEEKIIAEKFSGEKKGDSYLLKGVSSRKKEIVPPILDFYNNNE